MTQHVTPILEPSPDRRGGRRQSVYMRESARVELTTHRGVLYGSMVDVSTSGLGVGLTDERDWAKIQSGDEVEIQIETRPGHGSWPLRGVVRHTHIVEGRDNRYLHLGILVLGTTCSELGRKKLSGFVSYVCPELMRPIAYCADPLFFGDTVHFQIKEIRPNGLVARTSLRNKSLFPGERLDLAVMVPNAGEFGAAVQVVDIRVDQKDRAYQTVELAFMNSDGAMLAALGEFVLTFARDCSVEKLRDEGFFLDTIFKAIRLGFAYGEDDWRAILDLRLKAYHSVGKLLDRNNPEEMRDRYDAFSRQIVARVGGRIVGAARIVFVGDEPERSEHFGMGIPIPDAYMREGVVEFSRFCNDPEFRGADIFIALMRQAGFIATRSNARYVIANCNSDLWQIYRKIGFRKVGKAFEAFGRKDCYLIAGDISATVLGGKNSGLILWNQVVLPIQEHLVQVTGKGRWHPWVVLQKLISPVIEALRLRKRFRRHQEKQSQQKNSDPSAKAYKNNKSNPKKKETRP